MDSEGTNSGLSTCHWCKSCTKRTCWYHWSRATSELEWVGLWVTRPFPWAGQTLVSPHWLCKQQVQGVATADSLLLCNQLHPSAIWSLLYLDVHDALQWQNRSWREKASINHVYLHSYTQVSYPPKGILIHPNARLHIDCCSRVGKGRKISLLFHWFLSGGNTNAKMQAVLLFHFEICSKCSFKLGSDRTAWQPKSHPDTSQQESDIAALECVLEQPSLANAAETSFPSHHSIPMRSLL